MPARAPSGKRVEAIDLNWPADDIAGWVEHTVAVVHEFLNHVVFFEVDVHQLNFAHAMALECQLLDTFADYADFSQPQNFYLQTAYLRIFGEFYRHQVPDAKWVQHPADRWLHPGIQLPDGDVVDLFAICERSEEHTSELQSRGHLVCRLLLEKKESRENAQAVLV